MQPYRHNALHARLAPGHRRSPADAWQTIDLACGQSLAQTGQQCQRLLYPHDWSSSHGKSGRLLPDGGMIRTRRMAALEAALLIAGGAVAPKKLAQLARLIDAAEVRELIVLLNESYDRDRSAFRIEQTAAGFLLMTRPILAPWLDRLHQRQAQLTLSPPMMETLTIIAYQQPVTRADVEAIRGVQSAEMIRQLIDRGLVRIGGEDDSLGRPFLYETTRQFLSLHGLQRIDELPHYATLKRQKLQLVTEESLEEDEGTEVDARTGTTPPDEETPGGKQSQPGTAA